MKKLLSALTLLFTSVAISAEWLPRQDPVPGGIAWVEISPATDPLPRAFLAGERVMVVRHGGTWLAIVGIPLTFKPGEHELSVAESPDRATTRRFTVRPKEYGAQRITLKNKRMVDPSAEDLERIERDQADLIQAFTHWTELDSALPTFQLPAQGRMSGVFGTRRFFNDQERQPHNGLDIAAPRGTPVVAPADGIVVGVGDYFFNGRTVLVDHGRGLISMYNHLDRTTVTIGTKIERGQHIGDIGMTGRATGPHLHWAISLNNTRVDPLLFVSQQSIKQLAQGKKE